MADKLYLVDGSGFIFRAYHALPGLTRADGTPVGAVVGFCNMMVRLEKDLGATQMAVIFDAARKTFRMDIYPDYKAHRPDAPEDLVPQFTLVREATRAFGLVSIEQEGLEADDLIASYAVAARAAGRDVVIVSGDKDLMQLVGPGIELMDPIKNKIMGEAEVFEKFGVPPDKVIDVQALMGDSTDNVPGVPGIGVKTAAELINAFGSLDALLARTAEIKQPKRREALETHAELARISRQLVTLKDDAPLPVPLDALQVKKIDTDLAAFLHAQGFQKLITRLGLDKLAPTLSAAPPTTPAASPVAPAPIALSTPIITDVPTQYELVQTSQQLQGWVDKIKQAGAFAFDTETDSLHTVSATLVGISLATAPGVACYIPIAHRSAAAGSLAFADAPIQLSLAEVRTALALLFADPAILKIAHNLKFDLQVLRQHGFDVVGADDTMLLSYTLGAGLHGHGLDELAEKYFGHKMVSFDEVCGTGKSRITFDQVPLDKACAYAAEDADYALRLWQVLQPRVWAEHISRVYERMDRPLVGVIADMESAGVKIDASVLAGLSQRFAKQQQELEIEIFKLAGQEFNVGSPKQLGEILFDVLAIPGGVKSKLGAYATGVEVLEPLAEQGHAIAQKVLDWRALSKLRSTYTESLPQQIAAKTGRVHTSFALALTSTGRLSSSDPNLQNIPIKTEDGKAIRRAFVAEEGFKLISVDYSQIELRLAAGMAGVGALIQAFKDGVDIHRLTAAQVWGVQLDDVTPAQRRSAKAINFGIIYGISGFGLAKQIDVSPGEAGAFIKAYLDRFHELRAFMETQKEQARAHGYVETLFGRRCYVPGITDKNPARRNYAERQAINAPLQGTAADLMKKAMIALPPALQAAKLSARLILQVHDELVLEAPANEAETTAALTVQVMQSVTDFAVPLIAEAGIGDNWADAH